MQLGVFGRKAVKYWAPEVVKLISEVEAGSERLWSRVEPLNKAQKATCKDMMQQLKTQSEVHNISQGVLATRRDVESLYRHKSSKKLLEGWRKHVVGQSLLKYLT